MTYEDILGSTFGKYSPTGGATNAPIIPIPVDPVDPPVPPEPPVPPAPTPTVDRNYLCFQNVEAVNNTITLNKWANAAEVTCEYTKDGENWTVMNLTPDENGVCDSIVLQPNEKVWLRGDGKWWIGNMVDGQNEHYYFQSTGKLNLSGNIFSICDKANFDTMTLVPAGTSSDKRNFGAFRHLTSSEGVTHYSLLKIVNADLSFDEINTVPRAGASGVGFFCNMLAGNVDEPNTYLETVKLGFKDGVSIYSGTSYATAIMGNMLAYCTNLKSIWLPNYTEKSFQQYRFTYNTSTTGTAYIANGKSVVRGDNGIPNTWTLKYYNPATGEIID